MDTMDTVAKATRTLTYGQGYTGKTGNKCWAARILGSSPDTGLAREFLRPVKVEKDQYNRPRTLVHLSYTLMQHELYQLCEDGERWYVMVAANGGEPKTCKVGEARAKAWIAALDRGLTGTDAREASRDAA